MVAAGAVAPAGVSGEEGLLAGAGALGGVGVEGAVEGRSPSRAHLSRTSEQRIGPAMAWPSGPRVHDDAGFDRASGQLGGVWRDVAGWGGVMLQPALQCGVSLGCKLDRPHV